MVASAGKKEAVCRRCLVWGSSLRQGRGASGRRAVMVGSAAVTRGVQGLGAAYWSGPRFLSLKSHRSSMVQA